MGADNQEMRYADEYFAIDTDARGTTFIRCGDGVMVVPLTASGEVLFIWELSPAFDTRILVLPGGATEPGEPLDETANRELQEEIGYKASQLNYLGELHPVPKYLTMRIHIYLARELSESKLPGDEDYAIEVEPVSLARFEDLITAGRLHDSSAIAALYLARAYLSRG